MDIEETIPSDDDDRWEVNAVLSSGNYNKMGREASGSTGDIYTGMRWTSIAVGNGDTIDDVEWRFGINQQAGPADLVMNGKHNPDPWATTQMNAVTGLTTQNYTWTESRAAAANLLINHADLIAIIQEIVDDAGWSSGDDIGLIVDGTGAGPWDQVRISDTGGGWASEVPHIMELGIDFTVAAAGGGVIPRGRQQYMALLHH